MSYLRKSWVPHTCVFCDRPASPWQGYKTNWAGSRPWHRGFHFHCALKEKYGDLIESIIPDPYSFLTLLTVPRSDFQGRNFPIPFRRAQ